MQHISRLLIALCAVASCSLALADDSSGSGTSSGYDSGTSGNGSSVYSGNGFNSYSGNNGLGGSGNNANSSLYGNHANTNGYGAYNFGANAGNATNGYGFGNNSGLGNNGINFGNNNALNNSNGVNNTNVAGIGCNNPGNTLYGQGGNTNNMQPQFPCNFNGLSGMLANPANNAQNTTNNNSNHPPTAFQIHVAQATGNMLPMFGYSAFNSGPTSFSPVDDAPVNPDYMVGPGDQINIRIWGQLDVEFTTAVDRAGQIYIPQVGAITVAGVRFQDLTEHIKAAVSHNFKNFHLDANLGKLHPIHVFVVGYANAPGAYDVSSVSTLVNALFTTGGPSPLGSMRNIQLRRAGKVVSEFDVYALLLHGDKSKDVTLQNGDVIYIPAMQKQAAIFGSVNQPAIYELKDKETLQSLLDMAGGLATTAADKKARIERIDSHHSMKVDEFTLDGTGRAREIRDGDLVSLSPIVPRFDNAVILRGNVASPGRMPWTPGIRVHDVIPDVNALVTPDYWLQHNQAQWTPVNTAQGLTHDVNIEIARTDINWDYAVIQRLDTKDLSTKLIPFNLHKAVFDADPSDNLLLQPNDIITIFSVKDIQVAQSKLPRFIRVEGEFNQSGVYPVEPEETLQDVIKKAGGLTSNAYLYGAIFTRQSVKQLQQQRLSQAIDRFEQELAKAQADAAATTTNNESQGQELASRQKVIDSMKKIEAPGRVVLGMKPESRTIDDFPAITLEDGDAIYVPRKPDVVAVVGAVNNENAFIYKSGLSVSDYLAYAGGPTSEADMKGLIVERADGSVLGRNGRTWFNSLTGVPMLPGDTIVVPVDFSSGEGLRALQAWTSIISQFGLGAAALKTLSQ